MMTVGELKKTLATISDETQIACEMNDEILGEILSVELEDGVLIFYAQEGEDDDNDEDDEDEAVPQPE
jgi:hypothetical protein